MDSPSDASPMMASFDTSGLYLQMLAVTNNTVYLTLNNATDAVYEIWSKTDLTQTNWNIETEVWPTNQTVMPFTVPTLDQTNLFIWARDWTGITSNGNQTPEWWFWKYFGAVDLSDTNLDPLGNTLLEDYTNGLDPNLIAFNFDLPLTPVASNQVSTVIDVVRGNPAYMAVLINDTNQADAVWQPYNSNLVVNLNQGNGVYNVLVGLRGLPDDATQTWHSNRASLYSVPLTLTITNPMATTVSVPLIQLQGYANEGLASLTFVVSDAAGLFTNLTGSITDQYYDTNLLAFTTNYFQCFDVQLTNGLNTITLYATDLVGNTTTTNISVILDYSTVTNPPALTVIWPTNGTAISGTNFTLQAQVDDVTATVIASIVDANGVTNVVSGLVERDGQVWINDLPLNSGTNVITVAATSAAGYTNTVNLNVVQNDVGLTIDPLNQFNQSAVTVTGTVGDPNDLVTVNSVQASVDEYGNWSADVSVNSSGTAGLNVQVSDSNGNPLAVQNAFVPQPATVVAVNYYETSHEVEILDADIKPTPSVANGVAGWTYHQGGQWNNWGWGESLDGGTDDGPPHYNDSGSITIAPTSWENVHFNGSTYPNETSQETIQTKVAILPGGQAAVGQTILYLVQAQVLNVDTGLQLAANAVQFVNQLAGTTTEDVTNDDGSVWTEAVVSGAAGAQVEVTPQAAGNISYNGMQVKNITPVIVANGVTLDPDTVTNGADFCVGQHIQFDVTGLPAYHYQNDDLAVWKLPGTFVNTNSDPNCDLFYEKNTALLTRHYATDGIISTFCWYVLDGQQVTVSVDVYYDFRNAGKVFKQTITGKFNVHRPMTVTATPYQPDGTPTVMVTNGWLSLGWNRDRDMSFGHQIQTDNFCSGQAGYTQLISGEYTVSSTGLPLPIAPNGGAGTPDTELDGKYGEFPSQSSIPANTSSTAAFSDGPADGLHQGNAQETVNFSTYLMFKPSGGIWVPLRLVTWTLDDEADNYIYLKGNPVTAPSDNDCTSFLANDN